MENLREEFRSLSKKPFVAPKRASARQMAQKNDTKLIYSLGSAGILPALIQIGCAFGSSRSAKARNAGKMPALPAISAQRLRAYLNWCKRSFVAPGLALAKPRQIGGATKSRQGKPWRYKTLLRKALKSGMKPQPTKAGRPMKSGPLSLAAVSYRFGTFNFWVVARFSR